jgi:Asp-tRNA(Asn)/Glu-tRNA(Gln) amidotransferase B subunit
VRRLANEVAGTVELVGNLGQNEFSRLMHREAEGSLNAAQSRQILKMLLESGGDPDRIAEDLGFEAMEADALESAIEEVVAAHPTEWERFVAGEDKLMGFFIGQIKSATQGQADLKEASGLLRSRRRPGG